MKRSCYNKDKNCSRSSRLRNKVDREWRCKDKILDGRRIRFKEISKVKNILIDQWIIVLIIFLFTDKMYCQYVFLSLLFGAFDFTFFYIINQ